MAARTTHTKYGKKARAKIETVTHEYEHGDLKSGSGAKVVNRQQAIAIGISEARKAGGKVPKRRARKRS